MHNTIGDMHQGPVMKVWIDGNRGNTTWVFADNALIMANHEQSIVEGLTAVYDFIPGAPLIAFAIPEEQQYGKVFKDIFLLKPTHLTGVTPGIIAMNQATKENPCLLYTSPSPRD